MVATGVGSRPREAKKARARCRTTGWRRPANLKKCVVLAKVRPQLKNRFFCARIWSRGVLLWRECLFPIDSISQQILLPQPVLRMLRGRHLEEVLLAGAFTERAAAGGRRARGDIRLPSSVKGYQGPQ